MKAIVLAGGFGTRLSSVVKDIPKPMAPVGDKPFLSFLLDNLQRQGTTQVVLAVHHLKEKIFDYFGSSYKGMPLYYSPEKKPLGTGGGLKKAFSFYKSHEPILCLNGDSFLDIDFQDMIKSYKKQAADLIIGLRVVEDCSRYGQVHLEEMRISKFLYPGCRGSGLVNGGVYVFSNNLFSKVGLYLNTFSFETEILEKNISSLKCGYVISQGEFIDIGVPESYKESESFFKNKHVSS